ncbi:M23 family metallopeptidase [Thermosyntropha sp.]|uniref:peptidoglycan DD-metalloendopeptidase family protein n=1 Tax=Thermosyntropha sp. TaxID=2740820 RepID=UPI0025FB0BCD|nr:M23 family metallopeptidase [Thermosyntropha sp.]MBO8157955.1 M23 family metallopeptidase [Thermosyntropha sp.]
MKHRWIFLLLLCAYFSFAVNIPTMAALYEGSFMPACKTGSILTRSQIKYYRVKSGDTLWDIAMKYGVDIKMIMAMNNINEKSILSIGQVLVFPARNTRIHVIKPGETMWDIAMRYDISVDKLINANKEKNPNQLMIGDTLKIPDDSPGVPVSKLTTRPSRSVKFKTLSYAWPLIGTITSPYGWRKSGFHHGLDIAGERGDPIRAVADGVVVFSGYKAVYGNMVIIEHLDGKQTVYAHARSLKVKKGQKVRRGQIIATVGTTGRTTGPHVHFEVRYRNKTLNPLNFLRH